jgi:hypothetical protein
MTEQEILDQYIKAVESYGIPAPPGSDMRKVCEQLAKNTAEVFAECYAPIQLTVKPEEPGDRHLRSVEWTMTLPVWRWPIYVLDLEPACDCGAEKAKTTHADWCSTKGKP